MQALFEKDFNNLSDNKLPDIVDRLVGEFASGLDDRSFLNTLTDGVIRHQEQLDRIIEKAAPDWPIAQIAVVDRNVLRLGLFELLFSDKNEVPARVAINEAIELAKTFGGDSSGRFVNGVLGAVYREMGEPGKDEIPKKKKRPKDVPYDEMSIEKLVGAVVYTTGPKGSRLALVHDIFGHWTLSKGHAEEDESLEKAVCREIKEEMNLDINPEQELGKNEYIATDPEKGKIRKQVTYFLAEAQNPADLKLAEGKGGLKDAGWFELADILDLNIYDDIMPIITKAIKILAER